MKTRKQIIRAIEIVTASFDSHIDYLDKGQPNSTAAIEKKTMQEYLEVLETLLELL